VIGIHRKKLRINTLLINNIDYLAFTQQKNTKNHYRHNFGKNGSEQTQRAKDEQHRTHKNGRGLVIQGFSFTGEFLLILPL
jgi:hypothetical protein